MAEPYGICELCQSEVLWGRTVKNGKAIPIDPVPSDEGNLAMFRDATGRLNVRAVKPDEPLRPLEKRVMPHFATCPKAELRLRSKAEKAAAAAAATRRELPEEALPDNVLSMRAARRRRAAQ